MGLVPGLGDQRQCLPIGRDLDTVELRGVVQTPIDVVGVDELDANRLVFGSEIAAGNERRTEVVGVATRVEGHGEADVRHHFVVRIELTRSAHGRIGDQRLPGLVTGIGVDIFDQDNALYRADAAGGLWSAEGNFE